MARSTKSTLSAVAGADKAVAGLAGGAALASGSHAYGAIVVVPPPANLPNVAAPNTAGPINYNLNGDGIFDFTFSFRNPQSVLPGPGVVWQANFDPAPTSAVDGYVGPFVTYATYAHALAAGTAIGAGNPWQTPASGQVVMGSRYISGGTINPYGGFANAANTPVHGFLGVRFTTAAGIRYGWIEAEVRPATSAASTGGIFFFRAAYEDIGGPINAGQVPEPGTIGMLALGAVGILGRRRKA